MKKSGITLLALWLVLTGLTPFLAISFSGLGTVTNLLAIASGVLLLLQARR